MSFKKLKTSKYLKIVPRRRDYAVYHKIFGNLTILDKEAVDFLNSLKRPASIQQIIAVRPYSSKSKLKSIINALRAKSFIVPTGYDEYSLIVKDRKYRQKHVESGYLLQGLQMIVSNSCNFCCKYCFEKRLYVSKERAIFQNSLTNKQMSFDVAREAVEKAIKIVKGNGGKHFNIDFFGGEPLLNWPVIKSMLNLYRNGESRGLEISYNIETNGSLITDEMARFFNKYDVKIAISFDSPTSCERVLKSGRSAFGSIKRGVRVLQRNKNWFALNSVLSRETLSNYDSKGLVKFAKKHNAACIGLILDLDLEFFENDELVKDAVNKILDVYTRGNENGIYVTGYWHRMFTQIKGEDPINLESGFKTCPAAGCKLSIEPEGHIFVCKLLSSYLGHISKFDDAIRTKVYKDYSSKAYENAAECKGCEIENFCSGACMGSRERKFGSIDVLDRSFCKVYREITRWLIQNVDSKEVDCVHMHGSS